MIKLLFMRLDDTLKVINSGGARDHVVVYDGDYMIRHESLLRDINGRGPNVSLHAIGRILPYGVSQAPNVNSTIIFGVGKDQIEVPMLLNDKLDDELSRMMLANFWHRKVKSEGFLARLFTWIGSHFLIVIGLAIIILIIIMVI